MSLITYLNPIAIKDSSISGSKLKDDSIPGSKLQNASIPGDKLQENTIEVSKIVSLAQSITWSDLKAKRDEGKLIPGTYYRITDYQCTTVQENTRSAGHQFDIIVRADDVNVLNEECWAAQHSGDTYFANSNLSAWKIWYCLDNDSNRFAWASDDVLIGTVKSDSKTYTFDNPVSKISFLGDTYNLKIGVRTKIHSGPDVYVTKTDDYTLVINSPHSYITDLFVYTAPRGVIYRMIDEFNNDIPYDFKNIQFTHPLDTTTYPHYYYTFASSNIENNTDYSLDITNNCYSNTIKEYVNFNSGKRTLNRIIFIGSNCYNNTFSYNCYNNTFGSYCHGNTLGLCCSSNSFGNWCSRNSFGPDCYDNTFGSSCSDNSFENYCYFNSFGSDCSDNSFGSSCSENTFGSNCLNNSFGYDCSNIKFASDSSANTKYTFYQSNHFGDGCQYILFKGAETASSSAKVQNYNFAQGLRGTSSAYLTIDGVRNRAYETYISIDTDGTIKESVIADNTNNIATLTTNLSNEITARTQADTELQTQINSKQEALTLTVKDNGNIVLANIQGQSKEFMPATPSGDPMHYAYVTAGAEYNDTGEDIIKTAPWADLADDDADKTVVHKAGYWYLNGLGDITNEQMRIIYSYVSCFCSYDISESFCGSNVRTNINKYRWKGGYGRISLTASFAGSFLEVLNTGEYINVSNMPYAFTNSAIKHIISTLMTSSSLVSTDAFMGCAKLKTIKIKLAISISFKDSPLLSVKSVLYMINNEAATSPITITLHADVYNRCMANADILAALQAHPNISLASA